MTTVKTAARRKSNVLSTVAAFADIRSGKQRVESGTVQMMHGLIESLDKPFTVKRSDKNGKALPTDSFFLHEIVTAIPMTKNENGKSVPDNSRLRARYDFVCSVLLGTPADKAPDDAIRALREGIQRARAFVAHFPDVKARPKLATVKGLDGKDICYLANVPASFILPALFDDGKPTKFFTDNRADYVAAAAKGKGRGYKPTDADIAAAMKATKVDLDGTATKAFQNAGKLLVPASPSKFVKDLVETPLGRKAAGKAKRAKRNVAKAATAQTDDAKRDLDGSLSTVAAWLKLMLSKDESNAAPTKEHEKAMHDIAQAWADYCIAFPSGD